MKRRVGLGNYDLTSSIDTEKEKVCTKRLFWRFLLTVEVSIIILEWNERLLYVHANICDRNGVVL